MIWENITKRSIGTGKSEYRGRWIDYYNYIESYSSRICSGIFSRHLSVMQKRIRSNIRLHPAKFISQLVAQELKTWIWKDVPGSQYTTDIWLDGSRSDSVTVADSLKQHYYIACRLLAMDPKRDQSKHGWVYRFQIAEYDQILAEDNLLRHSNLYSMLSIWTGFATMSISW